jgi:hypothetical protein
MQVCNDYRVMNCLQQTIVDNLQTKTRRRAQHTPDLRQITENVDIVSDISTDILCSSHIVAVAIEKNNPNPTNPKSCNMDYRLIAIA